MTVSLHPNPFQVAADPVQGTLAARPAAGKAGRFYYATDNDQLFRDTGTVWVGVRAASPLTLTSGAAAEVPLTLRGAAGQTGNLFEARNDAGTVLMNVRSDGIFIGRAANLFNADAGKIGLLVRAAASQTANLLEVQHNNGGAYFAVRSDFSLYLQPVGDATTPLVIQATPSQTANLLRIQNSSGTALFIVQADGQIQPTFWGLTGTRVLQYGAADSAGAGYRTVRIAN